MEGGLIFPDKCSIHLAGLEDSQYKDEKLNYWQDVYGFDYSPFVPLVLHEPIVDTVERNNVNTTSDELIEFDLNTVKLSDLAFKSKFKLTAKRQDMLMVWSLGSTSFSLLQRVKDLLNSPLDLMPHTLTGSKQSFISLMT